jgi:glycosyltransferase involved in cell wall biosynthesis
VLVDQYLPGYKAGGQLRAITNLVEELGEEFAFSIVTSDRDLLDHVRYPGIATDAWTDVGKARVMYVSPSRRRWTSWLKLLRALSYDILYVNGYFSRLSLKTLVARRWGWIPPKPTILAPHGELSPGALGHKRLKKRLFLSVAKRTRLHDGLIWHATTSGERDDIVRALASGGSERLSGENAVWVAPALVSEQTADPCEDNLVAPLRPPKVKSAARMVFLSRISRTKNLYEIINAIATLHGDIEFDIYGPIEDSGYWRECERALRKMPNNVRVQYRGAVSPDRVTDVFGRYHLLTLLTRGENFGYVIIEAMLAGCPVLVSDQTPWRGLAEKRAGWDVPIGQTKEVREALNRMIEMDQEEFDQWSTATRAFAKQHLENADRIEANRRLFADVSS